jgi:hypothetical protein
MLWPHRTTRIALCCSAAVLAGCAKTENAGGDTAAVVASSTQTSTQVAAPAPVNLADIAGKWNMRAVPTSGSDTSTTTYLLTATNSTTGWTLTFPGRAPMPIQVATSGDSITLTAAPYSSVRRKGVRVSTVGAMRLKNGDLVGTTTAHYNVKTADSVVTLNVTGTRTR